MLHIDARLDIESGAPVRAVIEGLVTATLHRNRDAARGQGAGSGVGANSESAGFEAGDSSAAADAHARAAEHGVAAGDEPDPGRALSPDDRTVAQIRADVLVDLCRHAIGCTQVPTLPTATVIVRIPLEALQSGEGAAEIDGINQPITSPRRDDSRPSRVSSRACSVPMARSSIGGARGGCSRIRKSSRSPSAMAGAPGAERHRTWRSCITSAGGNESAGAPTSTTACCSARPATSVCTTTAGRSRPKAPARAIACGSPRPGGSIPIARLASAHERRSTSLGPGPREHQGYS